MRVDTLQVAYDNEGHFGQHCLCPCADPPDIFEVVNSEKEIESIMPRIDSMMVGGMITLETARVIHYRKEDMSCC
jgi:PII-like signaling protein